MRALTLALVMLASGCGEATVTLDAAARPDATTPPADANEAPDAAGAFDPACLARCATCSVGYCDSRGGWCDTTNAATSRASCIAATTSCDELSDCIAGPIPLVELDVCTDGVLAAMTLARIAPLARDIDSYRPPSTLVRERVALAIEALAALDGRLADDHATTAGYVVCRGADEEEGLVLLRPAGAGTGHASIVMRPGGAAGLVLEAPHPLWDMGTLEESVEIFSRTNARALVASGTHRCASDRPSGCSGTADACGPGAAVRESDMAHAVDSVFHAAHLALAAAYPDDWFVGVHGFTGPGVSVSDGTNDPALDTSRAARLVRALHARFGAEVTTCNDFGDPAIVTEARLCGTTDVQARSLNGSAMECTTQATAAADRFAHLEQAPEYRPERAADVAAAILEVLAAP